MDRESFRGHAVLKRDAQRIFKYATILDTCIARFTREPTRSALGVPFGSSRAKPDTHVARDARDPAERGSIRIVARAVAARQSRTRTASYPGGRDRLRYLFGYSVRN